MPLPSLLRLNPGAARAGLGVCSGFEGLGKAQLLGWEQPGLVAGAGLSPVGARDRGRRSIYIVIQYIRTWVSI